MRSLLLAVLAAYVVSAIHAVLAFLNKRRALQRVSEWAMATGFVLHTAALIADWAIDGHYPLFTRRETLSFLAWTLVASYGLVLYRYRARPLGVVTLPLVSLLVFHRCRYSPRTPDSAEASIRSAILAFSSAHNAVPVCLRCIFRGLPGEHHVSTARARTKTQNFQRDLSPASFADHC